MRQFISSFRVRALLLLGLVLAAPAASADTISGTVFTYPGLPGGTPERVGAGYQVRAAHHRPMVEFESTRCGDYSVIESCMDCTQCVFNPTPSATYSTTTDANGNYTVSFTPSTSTCSTPPRAKTWIDPNTGYTRTAVVCYPTSEVANKVVLTTEGTESTSSTVTGTTIGNVTGRNLNNAPHAINGQYWIRRIGRDDGTATHPIFFIPGFNPNNTPGLIDTYLKSPLPNGGNLHDYLVNNGYAIWLLHPGLNGNNSIRGTATDASNGLAFQAMQLVKRIRDTRHPGRPIVVGGHSMGGVITKTGLNQWCSGAWAGYGLTSGCPEVSFWYGADSPFTGASAPVALQRYIKDPAISSSMGGEVVAFKMLATSPAARELLRQYVEGNCSTGCTDAGGCHSTDSEFLGGCYIDTSVRNAFASWASPYPVRATNGQRVPAIAFSDGTPPGGSPVCPSGSPRILKTTNTLYGAGWAMGDHHIHANTTGGVNECIPGSKLDLLALAHNQSGWWSKFVVLNGTWKLTVDNYPTFIPSESALDWSQRDTVWSDYWYNSFAGGHNSAFPSGGAGMLLSWMTEYSRGRQDKPVCSGNTAKSLGVRGICRPATAEVVNGVDDDGDDQIDEPPCVWNVGYSCDGGDGDYCYEGTIQCDGSCSDYSGTSSEVCNNGADDDCDGYVDEDCNVCNGTPGQWAGCRGTGCHVCREQVSAYPCYFENHPRCIPNDTCAGQYYTCNADCPAPTAADACVSNSCGNGTCDWDEDQWSCPQDCGFCEWGACRDGSCCPGPGSQCSDGMPCML